MLSNNKERRDRMSGKSDNNKNFKMWQKQTKKRETKDILSEADDVISRLILKTECNIDCKPSNLKATLVCTVCVVFAVLVAYVVIKY